MLKRLDHLICEVPDIRAAMRWFVVEKGYPEAWPIGRFWPQGLTSGIALGGINLELLLKERLAPQAFPGLPLVRSIEVDIPESPAPEWDPRILPLREDAPVKIHYRQTDVVSARVTAILTDEGDLLRAFL